MHLTPISRSSGYTLPPRAFKHLSVTNFLGLKARFSPLENVPTVFDYKFLVDRLSPKRDATIDKYSRMLPDTLRWRVISAVGTKAIPKAVVRSHLKHIWGKAFAEALGKHGYHANGRKLSGPEDGEGYVTGLSGTLEMLIYSNSALTRRREELVTISSSIIKAVQRESRKSGGHDKNSRYGSKGEMVESENAVDLGVASSAASLWGSDVKNRRK